MRAVSRDDLAAAFEAWAEDFVAHPEQYSPLDEAIDPADYGQRCADALAGYVRQIYANRA